MKVDKAVRFPGGLVGGGNVENTVGVDIEGNLDWGTPQEAGGISEF